ncbi:MAG: hypothetical protein K8T89_13420 [Planctomycetes bacterium]|nr:hypothetical protein [Planctomycetota bacterium]
MARINPDPHDAGYKYSPTYHVTAIFDTFQPIPALLDAFQSSEIDEAAVEIFAGQKGIDRLDFRGKHHGVVVRMLHDLIMLLSDETQLQAKLEKALREGGHVVSIDTKGDLKIRETAIEVLKENGGKDVSYWGPLVVERHDHAAVG